MKCTQVPEFATAYEQRGNRTCAVVTTRGPLGDLLPLPKVVKSVPSPQIYWGNFARVRSLSLAYFSFSSCNYRVQIP